jgi:hypothetical protein
MSSESEAKIQKTFKAITDQLEIGRAELKKAMNVLQEEKAQIAKEGKDKRISEGKAIKFNVGGQIFKTTFKSLSSIPGSFFHSLAITGNLEGLPTLPDGSIFIDRDPQMFRYIINYVRHPDEKPVLPESPEEIAELRIEAAYFKLESLLSDIEVLYMKEKEDE